MPEIKRTLVAIAVLGMGALQVACVPPAHREQFEQYASGAQASSIGDPASQDYSELQALGGPNVGACGDNVAAWSPFNANPIPGVTPGGDTIDDWIELTFDSYMWVHQVKIYESYNPGAVVAVDLEASDTPGAVLNIFENFSGNGPAACPSAFVITVNEGTTNEQYNRVVIYLDTNLVGDTNGANGPNDDFNEIDAVLMVGDILVD